jgi:replicative DNA helicase
VSGVPHSEEAERAVLASILLDPMTWWSEVEAALDVDDFYRSRHREIYRAMATVVASGATPDLTLLRAELDRRGSLDTVGGLAYLAALDLDLPDLGRVPEYVRVVKDRALRRKTVNLARRLMRQVTDADDVCSVLAEGETALRELAVSGAADELRPLGAAVDSALEAIEDGRAAAGMPSGLVDLDRLLHGLNAGHLIVIAGRPGQGKSALAQTIAQHVALRVGAPVAFFSFEMTERELGLRVLCSEASVPFSNLRRGHLSRGQWGRLAEARKRLAAAPMYIDDRSAATPADVAAISRRLQREEGLGLIVLDYLQLMSAGGRRSENRNLEIGLITRALKALAKELAVPVLLLSQLSRESERRGGDKRPQLADLRDSGAIEADADVVLFVFREEVYRPNDPSLRNLAELIVGKHRHGATGTVEAVFLGETTTFKSMERAHAAA